jgi:uncharacterized protein YhfF
MKEQPLAPEWAARLRASGVELPEGPLRVGEYGDSPELTRSLLALMLDGRKRAGASLLWGLEAEGEPVPGAGQLEIVVDHEHRPVMVTRITRVAVVPFGEVTAEFAAAEGEGDGSLNFWRRAHWDFFTRECRRLGLEPTEAMPVVCSEFEVLTVLPRDLP